MISDNLPEYVIVESRRGYFEASRHTLVAMQKLMTEKYVQVQCSSPRHGID